MKISVRILHQQMMSNQQVRTGVGISEDSPSADDEQSAGENRCRYQ